MLEMEKIRSAAARVAASHGLELVDLEYQGGPQARVLRVFIEKNAEGRSRLSDAAAGLPQGVDTSYLSGVTHEDCQQFSTDFGTLLDVEDLVPGADYTLEVSSPGLDRKLNGRADFERFRGSLVKLQTFTPVAGNRHWQGRLTEVSAAESGPRLVLDLSAVKQKGRARKHASAQTVEIALKDVEKAQLVPEI